MSAERVSYFQVNPSVTILFLLYNAEKTVERLVEAVLAQRAPERAQPEWLRIVFVDDLSRDETVAKLRAALARRGSPEHVEVIAHERNLGLAGTLNDSLSRVSTPYVLTCHCDVFFGSDDYVWRILQAFESHPRWAAITGKPTLPDAKLGFAEKLNNVSNLMDVLPVEAGEPAFRPVEFAEGRCDGFRMSALQQVGLYDTSLRTSGEDQVLAARLRAAGYEIVQGLRLPYKLSVSDEQNSVARLIRHVHLFGWTQPLILAKTRGIASSRTVDGPNRRARRLLRILQLGAFACYSAAVPVLVSSLWFGPVASLSGWALLSLAALSSVGKLLLAVRHIALVQMTPLEMLKSVLLQPALDIAYGLGFARGALRALVAEKNSQSPIRT